MSSLRHDRLPVEGPAPADQATTALAPSRPTSTSSTGTSQGKAGFPVPPQRQGETQPAGTPLTTDPTARSAAARATTGSTAAPTGRARSGGRHRVETPTAARIAAARAVVARAIAAKVAADAPATVRPTPFERTAAPVPPVGPVSSSPAIPDETTAAEPAGVVPDEAGGRSLLTRRPVSSRRRRSLYLAAALVGALGISGASIGEPTEVRTTTVSQSVSVAEELGIEGPVAARGIADVDATSRLGELVVSRNARDAERTAAADAQAEADRLAVAAAEEAARPDVVLPVSGARLTSGFGARWGTVHAGIDLAAPMRTPEYAVMDGVVLEAGPASGYGLAVYIQHQNGDVTVYGHMDEILVQAGQVVRAGDTIALLGNRGQSTGPHLHFEVHVGGLDGEKIDPLPWLRERGVQI